jgi:hypothetical protein
VLPSWAVAEATPVPGDPLPLVRLVPQVVVSEDPGRDLASIDLETTAIVREPVAVSTGSGQPGSVEVQSRTHSELRVTTHADSPQWLVVATQYHPGWRAYVDEVPAHLVPVNGDFLGCAVAAGDHSVHLKWEPASHVAGWWVSVLGLALLMASLWLPVSLKTSPPERLSLAQDAPIFPITVEAVPTSNASRDRLF